MREIRRKKPEGYKELLVYQRADQLRDFVLQITQNFPYQERRRKEHMRDSARSVKQNIVEGWKRETTKEYIDFLSFSFGSLGELKEDGKDCFKDRLITKDVFDGLMRRCGEIDFLMGRLKNALLRKMDRKQDWIEKEKKDYEGLLEDFGLTRLPDGRVVSKEELDKDKGQTG
jgi:four helix bundle protein